MDQKAIIEKVVTALVTTAVLGVFAYFMGVFEKGNAAINKEQIRKVIEEELTTDSGLSHAAALDAISGTLIAIDTKVGIIQTDIADLEKSVLDLASE